MFRPRPRTSQSVHRLRLAPRAGIHRYPRVFARVRRVGCTLAVHVRQRCTRRTTACWSATSRDGFLQSWISNFSKSDGILQFNTSRRLKRLALTPSPTMRLPLTIFRIPRMRRPPPQSQRSRTEQTCVVAEGASRDNGSGSYPVKLVVAQVLLPLPSGRRRGIRPCPKVLGCWSLTPEHPSALTLQLSDLRF